MNIYYIGGSPCSGKSTVAEILSQKYGLHYFKVDDFLDNYTERGALAGYSICKKIAGMNAEEIWMRDPLLQCREEFEFYKEVFEYVLADLAQVNCKNSIITEGAAYVPELIKKLGVSNNRYISITPTKEFQIFHYKKREFVPHVLEGCADKEKAFCNWMQTRAACIYIAEMCFPACTLDFNFVYKLSSVFMQNPSALRHLQCYPHVSPLQISGSAKLGL